ncbi:MAG: elongation factor GreAB [Rickettsiaceae bacterium]|jgi:mRNA interferase MazF|nr:elongation factor GreAB [Rickettsiaceae bacterium]
MTQKLSFGEIWLADLSPKNGTEPGKLRPVLIIQDQVLLDIQHPSIIVIPLTTNIIDDAEPLRLRINAQKKLEKDSDLLIDQIRSIDNKRFVKGPIVKCDETFMKKVFQALLEIIGYGEINLSNK